MGLGSGHTDASWLAHFVIVTAKGSKGRKESAQGWPGFHGTAGTPAAVAGIQGSLGLCLIGTTSAATATVSQRGSAGKRVSGGHGDKVYYSGRRKTVISVMTRFGQLVFSVSFGKLWEDCEWCPEWSFRWLVAGGSTSTTYSTWAED